MTPNQSLKWEQQRRATRPRSQVRCTFSVFEAWRHTAAVPLSSNVRRRTRTKSVRWHFNSKCIVWFASTPTAKRARRKHVRRGLPNQLQARQAVQRSRPSAFATSDFGVPTDLTPAWRLKLKPCFGQRRVWQRSRAGVGPSASCFELAQRGSGQASHMASFAVHLRGSAKRVQRGQGFVFMAGFVAFLVQLVNATNESSAA
jgi:hypothetical protein